VQQARLVLAEDWQHDFFPHPFAHAWLVNLLISVWSLLGSREVAILDC